MVTSRAPAEYAVNVVIITVLYALRLWLRETDSLVNATTKPYQSPRSCVTTSQSPYPFISFKEQ